MRQEMLFVAAFGSVEKEGDPMRNKMLPAKETENLRQISSLNMLAYLQHRLEEKM